MESSPSVAVVILNWNGAQFLRKFLPGVVEHSRDHAEVWIIDNASTDDSLEYVRAHHPEVKLTENPTNQGFAQGYNEGLRRIEADIYVLLNSDVEVTPGWITPVVDYMQEADLTVCQPKIRDHGRPEWFEHAGATGGFLDKDGYPFCAGRIFNAFEKDEGQYDANKEVFWASGAALFVRATAYHEVGGLDEDFFAHMEEIDLCWRLKNRGHRVGACGRAHVFHVGGGTLNQTNPFKTYLNFRNNLFLLTKNHFSSPLPVKILRRLVLDGVAGIRFLTEGKFSFVWAVLKAHFSYYAQIGKMRRKRKSERQSLSQPNLRGLYRRSIVVDFFAHHKTHYTDLQQQDFS